MLKHSTLRVGLARWQYEGLVEVASSNVAMGPWVLVSDDTIDVKLMFSTCNLRGASISQWKAWRMLGSSILKGKIICCIIFYNMKDLDVKKGPGEISRRNTLQCRWCASIGDSSWTFLALDVCGARPGGLVAAVTPCMYRDQFHVSILFLPYGTHSDLFRWSPVHKVVKRLLALDSEEKEQLGTYIHQLSDFRNFAGGRTYSPISISHLYIYIDHEG